MSDLSNKGAGASGQSSVAKAYDRWAAQYDTDRNLTRDLDAVVLRNAQLDLAGRDVLELGCGTGKNTSWLAENSAHLTAMDFSVGMLAIARQRVQNANIQFMQHDISARWPLGDQSVDVVIGNLVLEHVQNLEPVYVEAARVLRPDGLMYFCELHPFRQLRGSVANFVDDNNGETVRVEAFVHSISEFVNTGIQCGLRLEQLREWVEPESRDALPRLVSLQFRRS